jgi:23S rRNA (pseudouridine1915-N3)-methyltransferase
MQIHIISIGKLSGEFSDLAANYLKMTKWQVKNTEVIYSKKLPEGQIKQFEASLIQKYLDKSSYKIVLDVQGKKITSEKFASIFEAQMMNGLNIDFIIGGAFGLDQNILTLANFCLSLSDMTLPHQLAKIVLLEQIYRAQTIINNHPYHK